MLQYVVTVLFAALTASFWVLQVVQHEKFEEMAENNHQRTLPLRAPRGVVFDRDGKVLVENRHSFGISIVREHTRDLNRTVHLLSEVLGIDEARIREVVERHRREPSYRPITIVQDATLAQVAAVTARRLDSELPDVVVEPVPTRRYPETMAAHLFGYVGEVNDAQLSEGDGLKSGDVVGQAGIEKVYNAVLMGEDGARRVVVNSVGREIRTLEQEEPSEGKRIQLTIDADVQKAVEDAFKATPFNGAAVVLDPRDGGVLAFASLPAYDPNAFAAGIDRATWAAAEHRRTPAAERSRDSGHVFARVDVQDGGRPGRPRRRRHHRRTSGCSVPATPISTAATSSAGRRAVTVQSTCGTRSSSRATSTSTPSATCSASTRSTNGRRHSVWA